jgi:hypothetical protein
MSSQFQLDTGTRSPDNGHRLDPVQERSPCHLSHVGFIFSLSRSSALSPRSNTPRSTDHADWLKPSALDATSLGALVIPGAISVHHGPAPTHTRCFRDGLSDRRDLARPGDRVGSQGYNALYNAGQMEHQGGEPNASTGSSYARDPSSGRYRPIDTGRSSPTPVTNMNELCCCERRAVCSARVWFEPDRSPLRGCLCTQ